MDKLTKKHFFNNPTIAVACGFKPSIFNFIELNFRYFNCDNIWCDCKHLIAVFSTDKQKSFIKKISDIFIASFTLILALFFAMFFCCVEYGQYLVRMGEFKRRQLTETDIKNIVETWIV